MPGLPDVVQKWRKRLPIRCCMEKKPRGRTIKALRLHVSKLMQDDETKGEGQRLKSYLNIVVCADSLRSKVMHRMLDHELKAAVSLVVESGATLPPDILNALLERRINTAVKSGDTKALLDIVFPFGPDEKLNPLEITIRSLGWGAAARAKTFRRVFLGRHLVPLISEGEDKQGLVYDAVTLAKARFEGLDIIELDNEAATMTQEMLVVASLMHNLIRFSFNPEIATELEVVDQAKGRQGKDVYCMIAATVIGCEWYNTRLQKLRKVLLVIMELADKVEESRGMLTLIDDSSIVTMDSLAGIRAACGIIERARAGSLPDEMLADFEKQVYDKLTQAINNCKTMKEMTNDIARGLGPFLDTAGRAFPTDLSIVEAKLFFEKTQASIVSKNLMQKLRQQLQVLKEPLNLQHDSVQDAMRLAQAAASECTGLRTDDETTKLIESTIFAFCDAASSCIASPNVGLLEFLLEVWESIQQLIDNPDLDIMRSAVDATTTLVSKSANLADDPKNAQSPTNEAQWTLVKQMTVATRQAEGILQKAPNLESAATIELKNVIKKAITDADAILRQWRERFGHARVADLAEKTAHALVHTGDLLSDGPWHKTVITSDFNKLDAVAQGPLNRLDIKGLQASIDELIASKNAYMKHLDDCGMEHDNNITVANANIERLTRLRVDASLMWHFRNELDFAALRAKTQFEIRCLRKLGGQEKMWLHPALYKRSLDALLSSTRVT